MVSSGGLIGVETAQENSIPKVPIENERLLNFCSLNLRVKLEGTMPKTKSSRLRIATPEKSGLGTSKVN